MTEQTRNKKTPIIACVLILIITAASFVAYFNTLQAQPQTADTIDEQTKALENAYHALFGSTPIQTNNYSFSPPVPMYLAVIIGLKHGGWNATTLQNRTIHVSLQYCRLESYNLTSGGPYCSFQVLNSVTEPVNDYSPVEHEDSSGNWVSYRYLWTIVANRNTEVPSVPSTIYFVDAETAELISLMGH